MCVILEHQVGRLEAEQAFEEWSDPRKVPLKRMSGIRTLQAEGQRKRMAALTEVLVEMSADRVPRDMPKRHEEIAGRVAKRLNEPFTWRTLYNKPYRSAWRTVENALASHPADDAATTSDRERLRKSMLVHLMRKLSVRKKELTAKLRDRLIEQSADEEGWDPIPLRAGLT